MANYECAWRTNYFRVKNADLFRQAMELSKKTSEDLYIKESCSGVFMLGGYGSPSFCPGWLDKEEDLQAAKEVMEKIGLQYNECEEDEDIFFNVLQKCVDENDAILFKEGGWEKLRYIGISAGIITSKSIEWIEIDKQLFATARKLLKNDNWETQLEY